MNKKVIKRIVESIYESRKLRLTNPEGEFFGDGLWFPSEAEDGDGDGTSNVSAPTIANRYSYQVHCRSKRHIRHLVERALRGIKVPDDIARSCKVKFNPMTQIEGMSKSDLPDLMVEFAAFLEAKYQTRDWRHHGKS